jgi:hypothetical protein
MLLVNTQMRELFSQNRGRGGRILCIKRIHFLFVENVCVGEYIFFLYWPWNRVFLKSRYLNRRPYLDPTRNDKSLQLALANGPFGAMTNVQSNDYPAAACTLKEIFQMSHQTLAPTLPSFPSGNVMLQLPSEINKESEAKKGIIKLMLLLIRGNINTESPMVSNITSALPSKGMQVVLNQPRAAQASQFADLVRMTLELAKQQDYTNIHSLLILVRVISKALASQILQSFSRYS